MYYEFGYPIFINSQAEELLEKTLGALDTMGTAVAGALSNTDPAVTLVTDNFGMAVAVKDAGNSNGDVMDAGFSSVTLEDNSGITGDISLQVRNNLITGCYIK